MYSAIYIWGLNLSTTPYDWQNSVSPSDMSWWFYEVGQWPSCSDLRPQAYRLLSLQFVHGGLLHIGPNLLGTLAYGALFERYQGYLLTGIVFELAVAMSALGQNYYEPYENLFGCSGGLYGLVGGNIASLIMNKEYLNRRFFFFVLILIPIHLSVDIILYFTWFRPNSAYTAHFTGFITGLLAPLVFGVLHRTTGKLLVSLTALALLISMIVYLFQSYFTVWPPFSHFQLPFHSGSRGKATCCEQMLNLVHNYHVDYASVIAQYSCNGYTLVDNH